MWPALFYTYHFLFGSFGYHVELQSPVERKMVATQFCRQVLGD